MKRIIFLVVGLNFLIATFPALGQEKEQKPDRVWIKLNIWNANYAGEAKITDVDVLGGTAADKGQKVDLVDDLDLDTPQDVVEIDLQVRLGRIHRIIASYFNVNYGGKEVLDANLDFGGYTFSQAYQFETKFQISRFRLLHSVSPFFNERGRLGLMWGFEYFWWTVGYEGTDVVGLTRVDASDSLPIFIPVVGAEGMLNLPAGFGLYGSLVGISVSLGDIEAGYTDLDLGVSWRYKWFQTGLGYRYLSSYLDAEDDEEINIKTTHQGMLLSLGGVF